jgi:ABC-type Zn uptake system ZnuABC Zn-binding protein ZnuA
VKFIGEQRKHLPAEAAVAMGTVSDCRVSQVVNIKKGIHCLTPKDVRATGIPERPTGETGAYYMTVGRDVDMNKAMNSVDGHVQAHRIEGRRAPRCVRARQRRDGLPRRRHDRRREERPLRPAEEPLETLALLLLTVVATTPELESLASSVGGDLVSVSHIVPAGQDAEAFQPRPQDLARIRAARAVIRVGVDYDLWLDRLLAQSRGVQVIDASTDVALLDVRAGGIGPGDGHAHGRGNPHYWLDPVNAEMITATLLEAFASWIPQCRALRPQPTFSRSSMQLAIGRALKNAPSSPTTTRGPTSRRFRLRFVIIESRARGRAQPAPRGAIETARKEKAGIVVREAHESQRDADFIASRSGAKVVTLASHGDDYLSLIDDDVRRLAK